MKSRLALLFFITLAILTGCSFPEQESSSDALKRDMSSRLSMENDLLQRDAANKSLAGREPDINSSSGKNADIPVMAENNGGVQTGTKIEGTWKVSTQPVINSSYNLSVVLYYQDGNKHIIPITRGIEKQEGIAKAAISALIDDPVSREEIAYLGIYPVIPQSTKIRGINIKEGTAIIDFSASLLNYKDEVSERNIISSIVYTLTEFKTINNVKILIDGRQQSKLKFGTDISNSLNRENLLINSEKLNCNPSMKKLDIYLYSHIESKYSYVTPVSIEISGINEENVPAKIIEMATRDYAAKKLYSEIPSKARLLSSSEKGGVLTLNFNSDLRNYGGNAREDAILKQLLYSMAQIKNIEKIRILIDGKEISLPEGTEVWKEIPIPVEINRVED